MTMAEKTAVAAAKRPIKLAYLVSHPIQYQAPLLRAIAKTTDIDLKVLFMSDFSTKSFKDEGFGTRIEWDVPLLEGYEHLMLPYKGKPLPVRGTNPWHTGIRGILKQGGFDALWVHGYYHPTHLRFLMAAKSLGIKTMMRAESQIASAEGTGIKRKVKEAFIRRIFSQIDAFLTIGTQNRNYYLTYGVPESKLFSVPYAVDNEFFQAKVAAARPHREKLRSELGLDPARPIILYASKLTARKRAGDLLKAYAKLSPDGKAEPRPYLLIIGDGDQRSALEAWAGKLNWPAIRFLGFKNQTDLPAYFDLCDVFVLASEREPWGLIVNEVMNAAKPVIVTKEIGSAADLVIPNETGIAIDTGDIGQLSSALDTLTQNRDLAARMGQKAFERVNSWGFPEDIAGLRSALNFLFPDGVDAPP